MSPADLQEAVYNRLVAYSDLTALLATWPSGTTPAIYDHVPQEAAHPYVAIGDDASAEFDTDTSTGADTTLTIHVWSRYRGRMETKEIQRELYNALHRHDLSVSGAHTVTCEWEYADSVVEEDGLTRHGVTRFRLLTEDL
jgi:hypothetical protein